MYFKHVNSKVHAIRHIWWIVKIKTIATTLCLRPKSVHDPNLLVDQNVNPRALVHLQVNFHNNVKSFNFLM